MSTSASLVMSIAERVLVEREEVTEVAQGEVSLHVLLLVNHAAAERFLVSLALEDLLFYRSGLKDRPRGISIHAQLGILGENFRSQFSLLIQLAYFVHIKVNALQ